MKCNNCNGTGREFWNGHVFCNAGFECGKCHGTGEVKKTNFEEVTSSPERLADFLEEVSNACFDCASRGPYKSPDCPFADAKDDPYKCNFLEWLKQEEK